MITSYLKTTFLACALTLSAFGQSTIKDALVKHWKTTGEFTVAVAKAMPAADYGFKPVPEEMSFGQLMIHISRAAANGCANASGLAKPAGSVPSDTDKDAIVAFLNTTFNFCNQAVAGVSLQKLDALAGPPERHLTGYEWLWSYFTHTAHHRGQAEVYLRLKGIKPPDYEF